MIQLMLNCNQARLNILNAILRSILRKAHHEKLIVAGQILGTIVSLVSGDARVEVSTRYKRHKLSKYVFPVNMGRRINWAAQSYDSSRIHEKTFIIN